MVDKDNKPADDKTPASKDTPKDIELDTAPIVEQVTKEVTEKVSAKATEQAAKDATAKVTENIIKSIKGEKPKPEDQSPWAKRGDKTPKSYDEVAKYGEDRAYKKIKAEQKVETEKQVETAKKTKETEEKKTVDQNKYWARQLKQLVEEGHIPAPTEDIQTKLDKKEQLTEKELDDPGVKARRSLWAKAREAKEPDLDKVYHKYIKGEKPAGATAPVLGSRKSVTPTGKEDYTYEDIHFKTPEEIREEG